MKQYFYLTLILAAFTLLTGCSSGKKALKKGDYEKAVAQAISRLRSNDGKKKAAATLQKAYKYAIEAQMASLNRAKASDDVLKWEAVAGHYQYINSLADQILRCPGCREVVRNPVRYDAQLTEAKRNAAKVRYELGVEAMKSSDDRNKAIEAHQHFLVVQQYVPRFSDVEEKLREAMYRATLHVIVEPIPWPSRVFNIKHEFFVNKINEYLHNNSISPYVRFYTPSEADARKLEYIDHVIKMEFDQFSLGNVHSNKSTEEVSRDSVVIATRDDVKIYGTVKAKLTKNEKSITGTGLLDFKVLDPSLNKVITQEKFPSKYTWTIRWASFNGDERALNDEQLAMVKAVEASAPSPQWMFEEFTAPLYDQVIAKIRSYYRNY